MPNWCVGTMKVRGNTEDLERFLVNGIVLDKNEGLTDFAFEYDNEENLLSARCLDFFYMGIRGIPDGEIVLLEDRDTIYFEESITEELNDKRMCFFEFRQAYEIDADRLAKISKEYNLDIKINGFDRGKRVEQVIEISSGDIIHDRIIDYDDEGIDWAWMAANPQNGG